MEWAFPDLSSGSWPVALYPGVKGVVPDLRREPEILSQSTTLLIEGA